MNTEAYSGIVIVVIILLVAYMIVRRRTRRPSKVGERRKEIIERMRDRSLDRGRGNEK